jgi:cytochrome c oxidase cbb3-type subunit 1
VENTLFYKTVRSGTGILITIGHLAFAFHFLLMLIRLGRSGGGPTLFKPVNG